MLPLKDIDSDYQLNDSVWDLSLALALGVHKQSFPSLAGIGSGREGCSIFVKIRFQFILRNSLVLKVKESLLLEEPAYILLALAVQVRHYISGNLRK